jgi:hypothetical protein
MAQIAESLTHISASIVQNRQQRHDLGVAIKADQKRRQSDVHSLLKGFGASRAQTSAVFWREAAAINSERQSAVKTMLTNLTHDRNDRATKQREAAAIFMRELSSGVASFLDHLDEEGAMNAKYIRSQLSAYRLDIQEAEAGWRSNPHAKAAAAGASATRAPDQKSARPGNNAPASGPNDRYGGDSK